MASVYILFSVSSNKFYIGSTKDLKTRIDYHQIKEFKSSFTSKYSDWVLFFSIDNLTNTSARKIELHLKRMKSRKYLFNLKKYPEITQKLISIYRE